MRILITGSRSWDDPEIIVDAILYHTRYVKESDVVIVHGSCPKGADQMADDISHNFSWTVERHPADWQKHGKRAGYVRNSDMVKLGADLCLAFIKNSSRGATMCADLADKAGIPVERTYK